MTYVRARAKSKGIPFDITEEDIQIPAFCPLLGIPLFPGNGLMCDNSPTVDRIDSSKGYVKGNVWVVSYKANRIKNDSKFEEFEQMYLKWKEANEQPI